MTKPICKCSSEACQVRVRRGLVPFCEMPAAPSTPDPPNVFRSYERAGEHRRTLPNPDRYTIVSVTRSGGPKRFAVVLK
jgi:hypothetical protein